MSEADAMLRGLMVALRLRQAGLGNYTTGHEEELRAYMAKHALDCDCAVCEAYAGAESVEAGVRAALVVLYAGQARGNAEKR